ncbi:vWA domain-containing protein [Phycicoccus sp. Root563]|uniref:vWA domain-containing protein n=1 Tax=Phycicoccus sp. Root563 TaxID=1736562 RepID=UPI001F483092|nr:vWA domain-containing protein [Phycicoccus sp. Root563]
MNSGTPVSGAAPSASTPVHTAAQALQFTAAPDLFEGPAGVLPGATTALEGPAEVGEVGIAVPGLIVLDVSWSMAEDLAGAAAALERFRSRLRQNGMTSSNAYLGIVTFADTARTDLQLTLVADPSVQMPAIEARGQGTNFHAAFTEVLAAYRAALPELAVTADGRRRQTFRPSVFFVSDGEHNTGHDWRAPLAELRSRSWKPNVFAFGYRDADPATIRTIADEGLAYFARQGEDPDTMFETILNVILRSMVSATVTANGQAGNPTAPTMVPVVDPSIDPATAGMALIDPIGPTVD